MVSIPRTFARSIDFSRARTGFQGYPENFISYGTVGHVERTTAYVRVEEGDVLVEVTLAPTGDEVVARLGCEVMSGGSTYFPISYGQRVVVGYPNGKNGDPVIISQCHDGAWPFPETVAGVRTTTSSGQGPMFAFMRTGDGQLLAIETGEGGDIVIHSGASAQIKVSPTEQILHTGRTHIGSDADFSSAPTGATVGDNGFVTEGDEAGNYNPTPNTNTAISGTLIPPATIPLPPPQVDTQLRPYPADGIVRMKDQIQINPVTSPDFFAWLSVVHLQVELLLVPPATMPPLPASIRGKAVEASLNTAGDD